MDADDHFDGRYDVEHHHNDQPGPVNVEAILDAYYSRDRSRDRYVLLARQDNEHLSESFHRLRSALDWYGALTADEQDIFHHRIGLHG
jgi:hypothetical protein